MRQEPELLVPLSERPTAPRPARDWRLVLLRLWYVLGILVACGVLFAGTHALNLREAIYTLAGFYFAGRIVAWIFRPALSPSDEQR